MLPYSPLHHLLLADVGEPARHDERATSPTSRSPTATTTRSSASRGIADLFLVHDRPIHTRTDDSVVRARGRADGAPAPLARLRPGEHAAAGPGAARRSSPAAPSSRARSASPRATRAWVGHHVGDLRNYETLRVVHARAIAHFERLFAVDPEVVAHDLHPDYLSTRYALERDGRRARRRAAPPRAPRRVPGRARRDRPGGRARSTTARGYGPDGTVWGGELLVGDLRGFERVGHLRAGPAAGRRPRRARAVADGVRVAGRRRRVPSRRLPAALAGEVDRGDVAGGRRPRRRRASRRPSTTSAGRLFDAVAALCGLRAARHLRGPGGDRARGRLRPGRARRLRDPVRRRRSCSTRAPRSARSRATSRAGVAVGRRRGALPPRPRRGDRARRARSPPSATASTASSSPAASSRTASCSSARARCSSARACACSCPARLPPGDGGIAYGQAAVAAAVTENHLH